jgi:PhnB protein
MAERDLVQQLDQAVTAMLAGNGPASAGPEVTELLRIAADLRRRPEESFKARLKFELEKQTMATTATYIRPGFASVTPYLHPGNAAEFIDFMKRAFGAEEIARYPRPDGTIMHAEMKIGDSILEMGDPEGQFKPAPVALHFYVENVDQVYQRAVDAGAISLQAPEDHDYGERGAGVRDPFGNNWYIATSHGPRYVPEGLRAVTPYLHLHGTPSFIDFLKRGFGAIEAQRHESPDGTVVHAKITIGDSIIEMGEAHGPWGPMPAVLHLYVENVDATYKQAIEAGAESLGEPADQPYGMRMGIVKDPAGNTWYLATHLG